jgi:hypothetical protein
MKPSSLIRTLSRLGIPAVMACVALAPAALGQEVTFSPYIQLGDNGKLGPTDQIVIAWQTDEIAPNASAYKVELSAGHDRRFVKPKGRVIDNYLAADPSLPTIPGAYGAHTNYTAVLVTCDMTPCINIASLARACQVAGSPPRSQPASSVLSTPSPSRETKASSL